MGVVDKSSAYDILGVTTGSDKSAIDRAHKQLTAFCTIDDDDSDSIKALADVIRADANVAYELLKE